MRPLFILFAEKSTWLLLARISTQAIGFVFTVLVARFLGEAGLGQYSFISAIIFLGNTAASFGMDALLIRELAGQKNDRQTRDLLGSAIWLQLILSITFLIALQLLANQLPLSTIGTVTALRLYSLALIPLSFFSVFSAALRAAERMDLFFAANLTSGLLQIVLGALFLLSGAGLVEISILLFLTQTWAALHSGWLCYKYINSFFHDS